MMRFIVQQYIEQHQWLHAYQGRAIFRQLFLQGLVIKSICNEEEC